MAFGRLACVVMVVLMSVACQKLGLVKQYEYSERVELSLDGSAVVDINASVPALVALRGATLDVDPEARFDRQVFRRVHEGPGVSVREVSAYRRHGRRFVHVRLDVSDISGLSRVAPLAWSRYRWIAGARSFASCRRSDRPHKSRSARSDGLATELIAFRVHLPSRITFHNAPGLERGNILAWEQTLRDRLAGTPLRMEARMETPVHSLSHALAVRRRVRLGDGDARPDHLVVQSEGKERGSCMSYLSVRNHPCCGAAAAAPSSTGLRRGRRSSADAGRASSCRQCSFARPETESARAPWSCSAATSGEADRRVRPAHRPRRCADDRG